MLSVIISASYLLDIALQAFLTIIHPVSEPGALTLQRAVLLPDSAFLSVLHGPGHSKFS